MELKIISPKEDGYVEVIEFNHEELKAELVERLKKYTDLVYTEESIQDAKKDRATLNKFKKAIGDKRKDIKARCMAPYNDFEAKVKEILALVDEPLLAIDSQVKGFEDQKKNEKQQKINEFWETANSNVKTLVSLERIFNPRWLNITFAMSKVEEEITEFFERVESELAVIEELKTEFEDQVVRVYLKGFSVAEALAENTKLLEQKAKREDYRKQQEEAAAKDKEQAVANTTFEPAPQQVEPVQKQQPEPVEQTQTTPDTRQTDFRVWTTNEQLAALKVFLVDSGIKYGPVPDINERKQAA